MKNKIFLVEDEPSMAMILAETLESQGYFVTHCSDGQSALENFYSVKPDLVVLDVMLPKVNGFSVAKTIRDTDLKTPIIFLTAKSKVKDVVAGFEAGGNDYLRKPFSIEELMIRIKIMLTDSRLLEHTEAKIEVNEFEIGKFHFNSIRQQLTFTGKTKELTAKESELLKLLSLHQNKVISKESILLKIWGQDSFFASRSMDVYISKLRKHLELDASIKIMNIRGVGYKLIVG